MNGYVDKAGKWHPGSDSWEALRAELTTLRGLVGDLAEMVPDYFYHDSDIWCMFCDCQLNVETPAHEPDCLWFRARQWKESR